MRIHGCASFYHTDRRTDATRAARIPNGYVQPYTCMGQAVPVALARTQRGPCGAPGVSHRPCVFLSECGSSFPYPRGPFFRCIGPRLLLYDCAFHWHYSRRTCSQLAYIWLSMPLTPLYVILIFVAPTHVAVACSFRDFGGGTHFTWFRTSSFATQPFLSCHMVGARSRMCDPLGCFLPLLLFEHALGVALLSCTTPELCPSQARVFTHSCRRCPPLYLCLAAHCTHYMWGS